MKIADHIENAEPVFEDGSVYRAIKTNGLYTTVYVFPFRLTEDQIIFFNKQVEQLGEACIEYRAAIPRVLSYGFTKTGSFPFIETEWIDGYSLDELEKKQKVLTIHSIFNVAEELSRAMAQCHKLNVLHGNISARNVIWDEKQKQYTITGFRFGLEPSKNPYVQSRSVVIIAPGQKHSLKSKQDDVQDIGTLLLQLLTGKNKWQPGDDLIQLHFEYLPAEWPEEKLEKEHHIPAWFVNCIHRAMGTDKDKAFENAVQLYSYILSHHKTPFQKKDWYRSKPQSFALESRPAAKPSHFFKNIKLTWPPIFRKKAEKLRFVFDRNIAAGLIIAALLLGFTIDAQKREPRQKGEVAQKQRPSIVERNDPVTNDLQKKQPSTNKSRSDSVQSNPQDKIVLAEKKAMDVITRDSIPSAQQDFGKDLGSYKVKSKAYFHNEPDETTRRNAFIVHWNNAVLHPLKEQGDFVYIVFTNHLGQTSKGWLRKQDLIKQ